MSKNDRDNEPGKIMKLRYNFIRFPEKWYYPYDLVKLPKHNEDKGISGIIEYTFENKSKLATNFRRDGNSRIYISGSEIKGRIRSNLEILGFSYPEFIYSDGFLYRDFTSNIKELSETYKKELKVSKIKEINEVVYAGYLIKEKNDFYIIPAKGMNNKINFATVTENKLKKIGFLRGKYHYMNNPEFHPFEEEITFGYDNGITVIKPPDGNNRKNEKLRHGYLYCSNKAVKKKRHYVIGEKADIKIKIEDQEVINRYNKNFEKDKISGEFYDIFNLKKGELKEKIVFYTMNEKNEITNVGRTPYLKISYKNTVKSLIEKHGKKEENRCSYAESIFGFTGKGTDGKEAYKSRVRFTNAVSDKIKKEIPYKERERFILPQPMASAFGMYLQQDLNSNENIITYNNSNADLRGYKFYHISKNAINKSKQMKNQTEAMARYLEVLDEGAYFKGKIYFNNLKSQELGLLLMSVDTNLLVKHVEKNDKTTIMDNTLYEQFGGAKLYGYGKSVVEIDKIKIRGKNNLFEFDTDPYNIRLSEENKNEYVQQFINKMSYDKYINSDTIKGYIYSKRDNNYEVIDYNEPYCKKDKLEVLDIYSNQILTNKELLNIVSKSNYYKYGGGKK